MLNRLIPALPFIGVISGGIALCETFDTTHPCFTPFITLSENSCSFIWKGVLRCLIFGLLISQPAPPIVRGLKVKDLFYNH